VAVAAVGVVVPAESFIRARVL
ncbi:MAG: hypothetical protein RIS24_3395, partial [Verrucomicrobiota bacterium]